MVEVIKDNFWDTDLKNLPWAIEINDKTYVWGVPTYRYTQEWIGKWVDNILRNK